MACACIEIHAIAVMGGFCNRRMAMDDQRTMIPRVDVKLLSDPQKVLWVLIQNRDPGSDPGMDKEKVPNLMGQWRVLQKFHMVWRDVRHDIDPFLTSDEINPIRRQGFTPAHAYMQPAQAARRFGIAAADVVQKQLIVIAPKNCPVAALLDAINQSLDHAAAVWPPIHQITQKDDFRILACMGICQSQDAIKLCFVSVDIGNTQDQMSNSNGATCSKRPVALSFAMTGSGTGAST